MSVDIFRNVNTTNTIRMKALIELKVSELNNDFIERLKSMFAGRENARLTISVDEKDAEYMEILRRSKDDLENGRGLITFTMEEFEAYGNGKKL